MGQSMSRLSRAPAPRPGARMTGRPSFDEVYEEGLPYVWHVLHRLGGTAWACPRRIGRTTRRRSSSPSLGVGSSRAFARPTTRMRSFAAKKREREDENVGPAHEGLPTLLLLIRALAREP